MKVFTQATPPPAESEKLDVEDIACLDKASLTSVVEFMRKFQSDASFSPPTVPVSFDSEHYSLDIDSDAEYPEMYPDIESMNKDDFMPQQNNVE